jgi:hypothetical protein
MRPIRKIAVVMTVAGCVGAGAGLGQGAANKLCHAKAGLQDSTCTPGAVFSGVTAKQVCRPGYSSSVRNVPESVKRAVFTEYGIAGSHHGGAYEVDHLISLELGGSNAIENLWPEAASPKPGFHEKDKLENALHRQVCDGTITLRTAQLRIRHDWLRVFRALR